MTDAELKAIFAKTDAALASLAAAQERTDAQLAKTDAQLAKTDAQLAKTDLQIKALSAENETTSKQIKAVNEELGGVGKSQGMVAEEFFFNSLKASPNVAGIKFDDVWHNIKKASADREIQIDVFLENGKSVALAEVKYRVRTKDVEQVQKTVAGFRELFPKYKDYTLYAGVAGFSFEDEAIGLAHEQGLFVLKRKGDVVETDSQALKTF